MNISQNYSYFNNTQPQNKRNNINFKGWKPDNLINSKQIEQLKDLITDKDTQKIAISGHFGPDGDCISSGFALSNIIHKLTGKPVDFFLFGKLTDRFAFLNTNKNVKVIDFEKPSAIDADELIKNHGKYDLAISVDTASNSLFAKGYYDGIFKNAKNTAKIDHHPVKDTIDTKTNKPIIGNFADVNIVDDSCNSATQVIMQLVEPFGLKPSELNQTTNESLYTGILTDTRNFIYAKNFKAFEDASLLIKNGVDNEKMQHKVFGNVPFEAFNVRQHLDKLIQRTPDGKIVYFIEDEGLSAIKKHAWQNGYKDDLQAEIFGTIQKLLKVKDVEALVYVSGPRFNLRSNNIDISQLATKHGGGGHQKAAGFHVADENVDKNQLLQEVIAELSESINKLDKQ